MLSFPGEHGLLFLTFIIGKREIVAILLFIDNYSSWILSFIKNNSSHIILITNVRRALQFLMRKMGCPLHQMKATELFKAHGFKAEGFTALFKAQGC